MDGSFEESSNRHIISLNNLFIEALNEKYCKNNKSDVVFHTIGMEHLGAIGIIMITPYPLKFFKIKLATSSCGYLYSSMKGAAGIRVSYSPNGRHQDKACDFTFVNAHLGAYEGEYYYQQRNSQVLQLMRSLSFNDGYGFLKPNSHCFFMGDLNYRTIQKFDKSSTRIGQFVELLSNEEGSEVAEGKIEKLVLEYDELTKARADGEVFTGFSEPCIEFAPTYKYVISTGLYNTKRSPSWCDRILYQSTYRDETVEEEDLDVEITEDEEGLVRAPVVHSYNSIKVVLSDHQPVFLQITVPVKAPESILAKNGYLQILPSNKPNLHLFHEIEDSPTDEFLAIVSEVVSGPTQIYMFPTRVDTIIQQYVRVAVDFVIGYGLYFGTTPRGRLISLAAVLIIGCLYTLH